MSIEFNPGLCAANGQRLQDLERRMGAVESDYRDASRQRQELREETTAQSLALRDELQAFHRDINDKVIAFERQHALDMAARRTEAERQTDAIAGLAAALQPLTQVEAERRARDAVLRRWRGGLRLWMPWALGTGGAAWAAWITFAERVAAFFSRW